MKTRTPEPIEVRRSFTFSADLSRRLKLMSIDTGSSVQDIVEAAALLAVARHEKKRR